VAHRPMGVWLLILSLALLTLGGLAGAYGFLSDPSGVGMGMDGVLHLLPVESYVVPGLFLLVAFTLVPIVLIYALLARPAWPLAERWLPRGAYWGWSASLALAIVLAGWLLLQASMIGFDWPVQWFTAGLNAAILAFTLTPSVRRAYVI